MKMIKNLTAFLGFNNQRKNQLYRIKLKKRSEQFKKDVEAMRKQMEGTI